MPLTGQFTENDTISETGTQPPSKKPSDPLSWWREESKKKLVKQLDDQQGFLDKLKSGVVKSWRRRFCKVAPGALLYAPSEAEITGNYKKIDLVNAQVTRLEPSTFKHKPFCFSIRTTDRKTHIFSCDSEEICEKWISYFGDIQQTAVNLMLGMYEDELSDEVLDRLAPFSISIAAPETPNLERDALDPLPKYDENEEPDWNELYQGLIDKTEHTYEESLEKGMDITEVLARFLRLGRKVARFAVQESILPVDLRRLQPLQGLPTLYMYKNMVFRMCSTMQDGVGMRCSDAASNDEVVMTLASHEQKGCSAYANAKAAGLYTPLSCTVDFKGFRISVTAKLPIDPERSIVYGMTPSGSVKDENVQRLLKLAAQELNLKEHVVFHEPHRPVNIHTSLELQAHRGSDSRAYVLRLSRVFPPDASHMSQSSPVQTALLRPELVKSNPVPLSSDSFRPVGGTAPDTEQCNSDTTRASQRIVEEVVPKLVQRLDSLEADTFDSLGITTEFHKMGVNMRYLGKVAESTRVPHVKEALTIEIIARTAKALLHRIMRELHYTQRDLTMRAQDPYYSYGMGGFDPATGAPLPPVIPTPEEFEGQLRDCVVDFFNLVLGAGIESSQFLNGVVVKEAQKRFYTTAIATKSINKPALFLALQYHCGVMFHSRDDYKFDQVENPIDAESFGGYCSRTKHVRIQSLFCNEFASRAEDLFADKKYADSLHACKLALCSLNLTDGTNNIEAMYLMSRIAEISGMLGDLDGSLRHARAALGIAKRNHYLYHARTGLAYKSLMEALFRAGDTEEAIRCCDNAVQLIQYHLGISHPLLVRVYTALGSLYMEASQLDDSLTLFRTALDIATKTLGKFHLLTAVCSQNMGDIHAKRGETDKAIGYYERAVSVRVTQLGVEHLLTASAQQCLAPIMAARGDSKGAKVLAERVLATRKAILGETHVDTLQAYRMCANVCRQAGDLEGALNHQESALFGMLMNNQEDSSRLGEDFADSASEAEIHAEAASILNLCTAMLPPQQRVVLARCKQLAVQRHQQVAQIQQERAAAMAAAMAQQSEQDFLAGGGAAFPMDVFRPTTAAETSLLMGGPPKGAAASPMPGPGMAPGLAQTLNRFAALNVDDDARSEFGGAGGAGGSSEFAAADTSGLPGNDRPGSGCISPSKRRMLVSALFKRGPVQVLKDLMFAVATQSEDEVELLLGALLCMYDVRV